VSLQYLPGHFICHNAPNGILMIHDRLCHASRCIGWDTYSPEAVTLNVMWRHMGLCPQLELF
jgi:hypothetical protein